MKVLVVADNPAALSLAQSRLRSDRHDVSCATSGWEALAMARAEPPDLIVLDDQLPDLASAEVCRELQARSATATTPVLFLVDAGDAGAKQRALDAGGTDFLTRPLDAAELRARVRCALRVKRLSELLACVARVDPLTELPDRQALESRLGEEWARRERHGGHLSVVILDPDGFRRLNERYGRNAGDDALCALARVVRDTIRPSDLAGRLEGARLGVILPETARDGAARFAQRCRAAIAALALPINGGSVRLTAGFGVAAAVGRPSPEALLAAAETALSHAKAHGPDQVGVHDGSLPTLAA